MTTNLTQALAACIGFLLALVFSQTQLRDFALLYIALFSLLFVFQTLFTLKNPRPHNSSSKIVDLFTLTSIPSLVVLLTGGIDSPVFFILYFLLFSLSFLYGVRVCLMVNVMIVGYFGFSILVGETALTIYSFLSLFSLVFMTPFTSLLGIQEKKITAQQGKLSRIQEENKQALDEASITEENILLWLTTTMREHTRSVEEAIQELNFTIEQRLGDPKPWQRLKHQFSRLEVLTRRLESDIQEGKLRKKS